ncbi:MAG: 2OG-Fe(II) oxygenase family protein [Alteraurantiacibacter sp.]
MATALFELNPQLDRAALAVRFAEERRLQIRDVLTDAAARELRSVLATRVPWGMAMQAGATGKARGYSAREMQNRAVQQEAVAMAQATDKAAASGDYAFRSMRYSLVEAVQEGWQDGGLAELLLEHLNAQPFLGLMREVTGMPDLVRADGHASCYAAQHFLGRHNDSHVAEGWRIAYVLNMTIDDWHPDWGGYLVFYGADGNVETGFRPRFNSLNLFAVPQDHAVTYVPPFAPKGRYSINGWLRDR